MAPKGLQRHLAGAANGLGNRPETGAIHAAFR
jgi:hypothetical protein